MLEHVLVGLEALAEVLEDEDAVDIIAELNDLRTVEPEVGADRSITSGVGWRPARSAAGSVDGKS